ncbi:MAG: glycogen/starch/alpha-glucan phosphorylase, partial [Geminicoccaceae bacterium]|nr:glycogen/starch/alpha-glucan phosphorylase [Geminicoccaceae bacterium]
NMKLALNGAVTIGTLDGANVEMLEHVGEEGMIIFGLDAAEAMTYRQSGRTPGEAIDASPSLSRALELLENGHFSRDDPGRFRPVVEDLRRYDHFLVTADFQSYRDAQARAHALFSDPARWWKAAACNTARMGWFSSDRTIRGYADDIWQVRHRG